MNNINDQDNDSFNEAMDNFRDGRDYVNAQAQDAAYRPDARAVQPGPGATAAQLGTYLSPLVYYI